MLPAHARVRVRVYVFSFTVQYYGFDVHEDMAWLYIELMHTSLHDLRLGQSLPLMNQNGATSGFEMHFAIGPQHLGCRGGGGGGGRKRPP